MIDAAAEYCRQIAAPEGSSLYYSTLFHPAQERRALHALFALLAEVDSAVRDASDPLVGRLKLQWWSEEIGRLSAGAARHPISTELMRLPGSSSHAPALQSFLAAAQALLDAPQPDSYEEWIGRLAATHGRIWQIAAQSCAASSSDALEAAARTGGLLSALEELQRLPQRTRAGRCTLPARDLMHCAATAGMPASLPLDDSARAQLGAILARIRTDLDEVHQSLSRIAAGRLLFCLIMGRLGAALCAELEEDERRILAYRTALTPIRKLWIACRTRFGK